MDWLNVLSGAVGAGVIGILKILYDIYLNRNKPKIDNAEAAIKFAQGGAGAVKAAEEMLERYDKIIEKQDVKIEKQSTEIETLKQGKEDRTRQLNALSAEHEELKQKYEDLEAYHIKLRDDQEATKAAQLKDLEETKRLRNDYANVQKENIQIKEDNNRIFELTAGLAEAIEAIKIAVKDAGIPLALNGGLDKLMASVYRLKAEREQRGKQ